MNSFLEPATLLKLNFFLGIFQGFCLKVLEDLFHRIPLYIFLPGNNKKVVHGVFKIIQNFVNNKINNTGQQKKNFENLL